MSIIREKTHSKNFVIINKQVLNDPNLSWKAKGLWTYLMGLPDDWQISSNELQKHSKDGREATLSALRELVDNGYAEKSQETAKNGQYIPGSWKIFESKKCLPKTGFPDAGNPDAENPESEKPDLLSKDRLSTERQIKNIAQSRAKPGHEPRTDLFFCTDSNRFQKISQKDKDSWSEAYPEINVSSEISKAEQWLLANPSKARKKLWRKFLVGWFTRANDKAENKKAYRSQGSLEESNRNSAERHKKCESNKKFAIDLLSKVIFNDPDEQNMRVCDKYLEITDVDRKWKNTPCGYLEKDFRELILKILKSWGKIDSEQR